MSNGTGTGNGNSKQQPKRRRKLSAFAKFIIIVFFIVGIFLAIAGVGFAAYMKSVDSSIPDPQRTEHPSQSLVNNNVISNMFTPKKVITSFAIFGLDQDETRTDVIIVGAFNATTKEITLLSIPRDVRVELSAKQKAAFREIKRSAPSVMKMNEVHSYAGKEHGTEFALDELENILGVKLDYYVEMNTEGFRQIIDTIGGVEMTLDRNYNYSDPTQNLSIHLKKGTQVLDGAQAEGLVRFRADYRNADLDRIKVQQNFMSELFKQLMNKQTLINNAPTLVATLMKYVNTNFSVADIPKYAKYISGIKAENIHFETLPGEGRYVGKVSYFIHDDVKTKELTDHIFNPSTSTSSSSTSSNNKIEEESSKDKKIQVLNGGYENGAASKNKELLEGNGFHVVSTGNYTGTRQEYTRIVVKKEGQGKDLQGLYPQSKIEVDETIDSEIDIIVIIGTD